MSLRMTLPLLAAGAALTLSACGARTLGGSQDCAPACQWPYQCDRSTGACECIPGECCVMVDCWCQPNERHCDGNTLTGCAEASPAAPGECGQICEYPALETCPGTCEEPVWGEAYCDETLCSVRGTESYWFALDRELGGADDCGQVAGPGPNGIAAQESGQIIDTFDGGFDLVSESGEIIWVEHGLPWYVSNCTFPGRAVTVDMAWESNGDLGIYCVQYLRIVDSDTGQLLVAAADGAARPGMGGEVEVQPIELDCPAATGPCGISAVYRLWFELDGAGASVYQTESAELEVGGEVYEAHNGRSYFTGECGDTEYAWYVTAMCGDG